MTISNFAQALATFVLKVHTNSETKIIPCPGQGGQVQHSHCKQLHFLMPTVSPPLFVFSLCQVRNSECVEVPWEYKKTCGHYIHITIFIPAMSN